MGAENQLSAGYMTYFHVCITPMNLLNLGFPNWDVKHPNTPQTPIPYLKDPYNQSHRYVVVNFRSPVRVFTPAAEWSSQRSCHFLKNMVGVSAHIHSIHSVQFWKKLHPWASAIHCPNAMAYFPSGSWGSRDFLGAGREWGPEVKVQALRGGEDLQKRLPSWVLFENVGNLKSCVWNFWTPCWWNVGPGEESNLTILENLEGPNLNLWDVKEVRWNKTWQRS